MEQPELLAATKQVAEAERLRRMDIWTTPLPERSTVSLKDRGVL